MFEAICTFLLTIVIGLFSIIAVAAVTIYSLLIQLWNIIQLSVPHIVAAINWIISLI